MCPFDYKTCGKWEGWNPVNRCNHTSWVAIVTSIDRPKSVRHRCVIEVFSDVCVLLRCFLGFSVGLGVFVIGLSQISSLFSFNRSEEQRSNQRMSLFYLPMKASLSIYMYLMENNCNNFQCSISEITGSYQLALKYIFMTKLEPLQILYFKAKKIALMPTVALYCLWNMNSTSVPPYFIFLLNLFLLDLIAQFHARG